MTGISVTWQQSDLRERRREKVGLEVWFKHL